MRKRKIDLVGNYSRIACFLIAMNEPFEYNGDCIVITGKTPEQMDAYLKQHNIASNEITIFLHE